jgi:hypothetical protein
MFNLFVELNFAEWFSSQPFSLVRESIQGKRDFETFKTIHVVPYINAVLAHAATHPNYLTEEEKQDLIKYKNSSGLYDELNGYDRKLIDEDFGLADDEHVEKNISSFLKDKNFADYPTFSDFVMAVNTYKKKSTRISSQINNSHDLLQYLLVDRMLNIITSKLAIRAQPIEKNSASAGAKLVRKILNCSQIAMRKRAKKEEKILQSKIESVKEDLFSDDDESFNAGDIADLKGRALGYLVLEFLSGNYKKAGTNIAGQSQSYPHVSDQEIEKIMNLKQGHIKKILQMPEFKEFTQRMMADKSNIGIQALEISNLLFLLYAGIENGKNSGTGVKEVLNSFLSLPEFRSNETYQELAKKLKDKLLINKVIPSHTLSLGKKDINNSFAAGTAQEEIFNRMFDPDFPYRQSLHDANAVLAPFHKLSKIVQASKEKDPAAMKQVLSTALNFGTDKNPVLIGPSALSMKDVKDGENSLTDTETGMEYISIEDECSEIIAALEKAGAI